MKKTLSVLLALLLLASAAGCSETTASPEETANTGSTAASPEETEAETEDPGLDDGLPEVNYDGYGFHIAFFSGEDVNIEEETGEALNDAIFRRNQAMDERFGIQLEGVEYDDYNKAVSAFHMELAYSAISDVVAGDMAMLADTTGHVYEVTVIQGAAKPKVAESATDAGASAATGTDATTTTDSTTTTDPTATGAA